MNLLNQYVKENNYNVIYEYVNDGFTGTNFEWPAFKRMIKDSKINMIITKDTSRLGRHKRINHKFVEKIYIYQDKRVEII